MAAPTTVDEFLDLLRKSGVAEEKRLATQLERMTTVVPAPATPGEAAAQLVRDGVLTNFQAEQLLLGKWRRFTIGKYKVLERLGSGGMGSVYLCEHRVMRRRVAVKVLPSAKANDPAALERFEREARAVAALDHPNIVHAYDIDQDESLHFLVMEYVDGASLQEIVKRSGPLDYIRAAHYIRQAAEGLRHAHANGLVHRDIKPGNLMVDRTGVVKLLDMGLARFFNDEDDILTKKYDENVLGTADYLAPEQATDSHSVDIRADLYSIGSTFYFVLTGKTPFGDGTIAQKLLWHQTRQPRAIRSLRPDLPEGLASVIARLMEKDPQKRYQMPADLIAALEPWTRTPIPPPTEAEMPKLSPAVSPTSSAAEVNIGSPSAPSGSPSSVTRRNWHIVGGPTASATSAEPANAPEPAAAAPAKPRSKAEFVLGQEQQAGKWMPFKTPVGEESSAIRESNPHDDDSIPLEAGSSNTEDASSLTDTPTQPSPVRKARTMPAVALRGGGRSLAQRRGLLFVLLALLFSAAMGFGMLYFLQRNTGTGSTGRAVRRVSTNPANQGAFPSLQQALRESKAGDKIVLLDPTLAEAVVVDASAGPSTVSIEAGEGVKVRWIAPSGHSPNEPLLRLNSATGFQLKGSGISLIGQNKLQTLVQISGNCPGLTLDALEMRGFVKSGILLTGADGETARPIRLLRLKAAAAPDSTTAEGAIVFAADSSRKCNHIVIEDLRTEPIPFGMEPVVRNSNAVGEDIRILPERSR
jgi:serine/threonine protein kinase